MKKSLYFVSVLYVSVLCQGNQKKCTTAPPLARMSNFTISLNEWKCNSNGSLLIDSNKKVIHDKPTAPYTVTHILKKKVDEKEKTNK